MPIFLLQGIDEQHPWAGPIIFTVFCLVFALIAYNVKKRMNAKMRSRDDLFEALSQKLGLSFRRLLPHENPDLYGYNEYHNPLPKAYGWVSELTIPLDGWRDLMSDADCYIPIESRDVYVVGEHRGQNLLIADARHMEQDAEEDKRTPRNKPVFYWDMWTEATIIAVYWEGMDLPCAMIRPRGHRMPDGIKAEGFLGSASFNPDFCVTGDEEDRIQQRLLTQALTDWCKAHPNYGITFYRSAAVVWLKETLMTLEELDEGIDAVTKLGGIIMAEERES